MSRNIIGKIARLPAKAKASLARLARRLGRLPQPVKYAGAYLLMVLLVTGLMWWRFNPARHVAIPPDGGFNWENSDHQADGGADETPGEEAQQPQPSDPETARPDHLDSTVADLPDRDWLVFVPGRDNLGWPLGGDVVNNFGEPHYRYPGNLRAGIDGIHIAGEIGQPVRASWSGVVEEILPADGLLATRIVLAHGQWKTVYVNVTPIAVEKGQRVEKGQELGKLGDGRADGWIATHGKPFLEFQVLDQEGQPRNPMEFLEQLQ